jgi:hypothetical protein
MLYVGAVFIYQWSYWESSLKKLSDLVLAESEKRNGRAIGSQLFKTIPTCD